jgi:hypothetical protein
MTKQDLGKIIRYSIQNLICANSLYHSTLESIKTYKFLGEENMVKYNCEKLAQHQCFATDTLKELNKAIKDYEQANCKDCSAYYTLSITLQSKLDEPYEFLLQVPIDIYPIITCTIIASFNSTWNKKGCTITY